MRVENFSLKLVVAIIILRTSVCLMHHYTRSLAEGQAKNTDTFKARSKIQCAAACATSETCTSFSYNKKASQCIHSSGLLDQAGPGQAVYSDNRLEIPTTVTTSFADTTSTTVVTTMSTVPCPGDFQKQSGKCFKSVNSEKTWDAAQTDCEGRGGHLYIVRTEQELTMLAQAIPANGYWVDGRGGATWDGSQLLSTKWKASPPTTSTQCPIFEIGDMIMEHKDCVEKKQYICQIDGIPRSVK